MSFLQQQNKVDKWFFAIFRYGYHCEEDRRVREHALILPVGALLLMPPEFLIRDQVSSGSLLTFATLTKGVGEYGADVRARRHQDCLDGVD